MHTRYRSLHLCIVTRTFTSGCLQLIRYIASRLQHIRCTLYCKGAKYTLYCFKSETSLVWNYGMEYIWNKILEWNGIWKKILVWNGKFLVWNGNRMEENCQYGIWKNHLPFCTMP